jgi:hypothetical protein
VAVTFSQTETNLFNQLFGSANYATGGIGRADKAHVLRVTTEERLIEAARLRESHLLELGTDYVVFKAGTPFRKVFAYSR